MKNENEQKKLFALLDKFDEQNAELSTKELHQIIFILGSEREKANQWTQQHWEKTYEGFDKVNYKRISDRMKQQMGTTELASSTKLNTDKRLSFTQILYRSAAALLLPFIGLSIYFFAQTININKPMHTEIVAEVSEQHEYLSLPGVWSKIKLPDGTTIAMSEGGQLDLDANFLSGNTREISLEGEAFFDIAHNPQKPFIIHTKGIKTTALGTSFTVKAMPDESLITVTVVEGKVKVEDCSNLLATLETNQRFIYGIETEQLQEKTAETEMVKVEVVDVVTEKETEIDWQPHDLIFRNMSFGDIAQVLAVGHGVNIVFENENLKRQRIDVLLDNRNSIDELLKFLCDSQRAYYTVEGKTYKIKPIK